MSEYLELVSLSEDKGGECKYRFVQVFNPLSPNVADLQHFDIELFVASVVTTLFAQALNLLQLVY